MSGKAPTDGRKIIAENRRARHDYEILETYEAGLALVGTEVKSLRGGTVTMSDAYIVLRGGEGFVVGMHIPVYSHGSIHNHEPARDRKLLLHRKELDELEAHTTRKGNTAVPLSLYFRKGRVKLAIAVGKGKSRRDKRDSISERDTKRQIEREHKVRIR